MATNNTQQKAAPKKEQKSVPAVSARIDRMVDFEGSKTKAIASANIGGAFAIHGIKIMDSDKGLFVSMPQSKYEKDGKTHYSEIFHPVTAEARNKLYNAVLTAYGQKLDEEQSQEQDAPEEDNALTQSM